MFNRLLYVPYYILHTQKKRFKSFWQYTKNQTSHGNARIFFDMVFCSFRYNISYLDYFELRFFELDKKQRKEYMGSGAMYEYQLKMNPRKFRSVLSDKIRFLEKFGDMNGREWGTLEMLCNNKALCESFLNNKTGQIVLKNSEGQAGKQVEVYDTSTLTAESLINLMQRKNFNLIEVYVVQHNDLMRLSPSGLNTIRVITQIDDNGKVVVIATRIRVSVNSKVDNISVGNFAAHVDAATGVIAGPGIYYDITKPDVYAHPVTGVPLIGFAIPLWHESIEFVKKAALRIPENRSIGWDLAITNNGPALIEGNHNWHYFIWQMPERTGYKKKLMVYLKP